MFRSRHFVIPAMFFAILAGHNLWKPPDPPVIVDSVVTPEPLNNDNKLAEERQAALRRAGLHLDWAQKEGEKLVEERLRDLDQFFAHAKKNIPAFADDVLGWGSKWRLITDHVPLVGTAGAHERFLAESFAKRLFTREALERLVSEMLNGLMDDLHGIEAQLLVKIHQDVESIVEQQGLAPLTLSDLERRFQNAMTAAQQGSQAELRNDAIQLLVGAIIVETITRVVARMGISSGILGTGAVTSGPSLGTTLVIALVIDQIICWLYDHIADPHEQLVGTLNRWFDDLHHTLVEGTEKAPGLRFALQETLRHRDAARRAAVQELVGGKDGQP